MKNQSIISQIGKIALSLLALLLLFNSCSNEPGVEQNKYENFFSEVHNRGQFNGNALVYEDGEIVFQGSFGIGNIDPVDSLKLNSVFRLASVSKQFTAMAIMKLKEAGKLSYDQNIKDFIPELPYEGITIRHLLNHVSGLPDYERLMMQEWQPELAYNDPKRAISGNQDIIALLSNKRPPVQFSPGEKWEYSNTGYVLLASIINKASGVPFEDYLKKEVFDPVGMQNTVVYDYVPGFDERMPNRVYGFKTGLNDNEWISTDYHFLNYAQGDGGIYSTLEDLLKWDRFLHEDLLVSQETKKEAFSPALLNNGDTTDYGFGWFIRETPGGTKSVEHSGHWVGFANYFFRGIEDDKCFVILTNNSSAYDRSITEELKKLMYDRPIQMPKKKIREVVAKIAFEQGIEVAIEEYTRLKVEDTVSYYFDADELLYVSESLIEAERTEDALALLMKNIEEYPDSKWTYQITGNLLLEIGDTIKALSNYHEALEIDSTFIPAISQIEKINDEESNQE